jgi:hypothetical protein
MFDKPATAPIKALEVMGSAQIGNIFCRQLSGSVQTNLIDHSTEVDQSINLVVWAAQFRDSHTGSCLNIQHSLPSFSREGFVDCGSDGTLQNVTYLLRA